MAKISKSLQQARVVGGCYKQVSDGSQRQSRAEKPLVPPNRDLQVSQAVDTGKSARECVTARSMACSNAWSNLFSSVQFVCSAARKHRHGTVA